MLLTGRGGVRTNYREVEQLLVVQTLGLDGKEGGVTLTLAAKGDSEQGVRRMKAPGSSVTAAMDRIRASIYEEELFCAHAERVLVGEKTAEAGLDSFLAWLERSPEMRLDLPLYVVRSDTAERAMLEVDGVTALNDVAIMREMTGHAAILDLSANGSSATRYMADGVIVATPTGSTAYSLAAGGPVLMPDSRSFVVTPMNPHALGVRPMVVSDTVRLRVTSRRHVAGARERVGVYADGENVRMLEPGDTVEIAKSQRCAKLIELEGYDPYEVLSRKLGWRGSSLAEGER